MNYHNEDRIHDGLGKDTPDRRPIEQKASSEATVISLVRLGGLHHRYSWAEAADSQLPLVFAAAGFDSMAMCVPLVRVLAKSASFPKATHRCHSVRDSQEADPVLQDVLAAGEKIAMLVGLAAFLAASLPMKPIRVIRLRYIRFALFCPFVSGTRKRVGAAPKSRSCFSGDRNGTEPKGCESKAVTSQTPGTTKAPKQCRDNEQDRKRDRTDRYFAGRSCRRNAVIQTTPVTRAPFRK